MGYPCGPGTRITGIKPLIDAILLTFERTEVNLKKTRLSNSKFSFEWNLLPKFSMLSLFVHEYLLGYYLNRYELPRIMHYPSTLSAWDLRINLRKEWKSIEIQLSTGNKYLAVAIPARWSCASNKIPPPRQNILLIIAIQPHFKRELKVLPFFPIEIGNPVHRSARTFHVPTG